MWARYFFPKYFKVEDAPFHKKFDTFNLRVYKGTVKSFTNIGFRGCAKSTRGKLFFSFCIANDTGHFQNYIKILTKDLANSKQIVTDIYNMFVDPEMKRFYPEVFRKTEAKREETMGSFTTSTGVKLTADTVGTDQRGDIQEESRPGLILFEDFETRKTLRSAVETKAIWDNMEEARTGLALTGGCIYNCNYISERGNVHKLIGKADSLNIVMITRIRDKVTLEPKWPGAYTKADVTQIEKSAEDFPGEYMCEPSAGMDVFFDREMVNKQIGKSPVKFYADFKVFYPFNPSHRYGSGHDIGGGVGLDHSTSVFIDFSTMPARVVGTFKSNTIKPDIFGDEIEREALIFGKPIVAPENNKFDMCVGRLKQIYENIFFTTQKDDQSKVRNKVTEAEKTYGWSTNAVTKPTMLFSFRKALEDGLLELTDPDLIAEARSYSRDDLMDRDADPRLSTRHFDLLMAAAIAWQMKDHAEVNDLGRETEVIEEASVKYREIGV